jgi:DnaK suppressor protein
VTVPTGDRGGAALVYATSMSEAPQDQDPLRAELVRERDILRERVEALDSKGDDLGWDDNFADSGQVAAEMGENRVLYDQLRRDLDDIEKALQRMDEGTYGTCEVCGNAIGEARLEVMPSTRVCIDHA